MSTHIDARVPISDVIFANCSYCRSHHYIRESNLEQEKNEFNIEWH